MRILPLMAALLLALIVYDATVSISMSRTVDDAIVATQERSRPAQLQLTLIDPGCADCPTLPDVARIKQQANVTKETTLLMSGPESTAESIAQARALIDQHGITRLPAMVMVGELEKAKLQDPVVQTKAIPFVDANALTTVGVVRAVVLESSCVQCFNYSSALDALRGSGVALDIQHIAAPDARAGIAAGQWNVTKLPALLIDASLSAYPDIAPNLASQARQDGSYLFTPDAPFEDPTTGEVQGLVNITFITAPACADCYDVSVHKGILSRFGVGFGTEQSLSAQSDEGKAMLARYGITNVPTVILSSEMGMYANLITVWQQVGTQEPDGSFIFRDMSGLGVGTTYLANGTRSIVTEAAT